LGGFSRCGQSPCAANQRTTSSPSQHQAAHSPLLHQADAGRANADAGEKIAIADRARPATDSSCMQTGDQQCHLEQVAGLVADSPVTVRRGDRKGSPIRRLVPSVRRPVPSIKLCWGGAGPGGAEALQPQLPPGLVTPRRPLSSLPSRTGRGVLALEGWPAEGCHHLRVAIRAGPRVVPQAPATRAAAPSGSTRGPPGPERHDAGHRRRQHQATGGEESGG